MPSGRIYVRMLHENLESVPCHLKKCSPGGRLDGTRASDAISLLNRSASMTNLPDAPLGEPVESAFDSLCISFPIPFGFCYKPWKYQHIASRFLLAELLLHGMAI
jgi:hypothetical protein